MTNYIQSLPNDLIDKIYHNLHILNMKELSEQIYDVQDKHCHEAICLIRYFLNTPIVGVCPLQTMYNILEIVTCMSCYGYLEVDDYVYYITTALLSRNYSSDDDIYDLLYTINNDVCYIKGFSLKQLIDVHKVHISNAVKQFEDSNRWVEDNVK